MRCEQIEVKFRIPVPIDKPDRNNNVYTEKAVRNACKNAAGLPIIQYNDKGDSVPVGIANSVEYSGGFITVEGIAFYGGTSESVELDALKQIDKMTIHSFGICE